MAAADATLCEISVDSGSGDGQAGQQHQCFPHPGAANTFQSQRGQCHARGGTQEPWHSDMIWQCEDLIPAPSSSLGASYLCGPPRIRRSSPTHLQACRAAGGCGQQRNIPHSVSVLISCPFHLLSIPLAHKSRWDRSPICTGWHPGSVMMCSLKFTVLCAHPLKVCHTSSSPVIHVKLLGKYLIFPDCFQERREGTAFWRTKINVLFSWAQKAINNKKEGKKKSLPSRLGADSLSHVAGRCQFGALFVYFCIIL